jgi:heptosyltransferase-2
MKHLKQILLVQTAFIGDVILLTPLIRATKELFPDAALDVLVIPQTRAALQNNPHIRKIHLFDKRGDKWSSWWNLLHEIRQVHYDLVIAPHSSYTTSLLLQCANIPMRLGFNRNLGRIHLTHKVPWPRGIHRIQKNLQLLSVFSDKTWSMQTELFPGESELAKTAEWMTAFIPGRNIIALSPGSVWPTKRWGTEHFSELAKGLAEAGFQLLFTGSAEERPMIEEIITKAGVTALNIAGQATLMESAAAISKCCLMICNDSGALHLANAMQVDVYAFFGPTVRRIGYYPYREHDFVWEVDLKCRPCGSHGSKECPLGHHNCMKKIDPQTVLQKVKENYDVFLLPE